MKTDTLTIRSSIKQELYAKILKRGSFLGALGMLPILYGALFMDVPTLSTWGIPLFFIGMGLIALGMLPLRRLTRLQQNPNLLILVEDKFLEYHPLGEKTLTIPCDSIETLSFFENDTTYGICLKLKNSKKVSLSKVLVHNPRFSYERYKKESQKQYQCDLFFPYFSQRGFQKLQNPGVFSKPKTES